ncbi:MULTISPECIES: DUF2197 domain-containing protein [Thermoactinomyces]|jgi:uncharacterized protein YlaI|uniref:DUF2197 domain-containing protein n=2 Tax=Thermoactinomyces TaxID=2023 RepID=A0A8I1A297_THEIN|nr:MULTISPECIES: DUF2197 domain-containing protein [Thermoactinomyces]MBA4547589.1 DUF2197 domain-containing protein [Thermoactinomyces intermedius]MBA4551706.1 DUF2197 domain-containing protein [Thermoactinomyces vulgaris]MBA4596415.1 DUF2197 domain-containing protein [Thermoactinomyces vulgaris]MBA4836229.1 DUF2197 domain-containing protein [Thermoactinomyces intermedius]MBH8582854.1 DUF2197 domain-containing protein [Thermoactinomyces sp. CICC 10735]
MKVICILCDQVFRPDPLTEKKIKKHPHRIQICPQCHERITKQVTERKKNQSSKT